MELLVIYIIHVRTLYCVCTARGSLSHHALLVYWYGVCVLMCMCVYSVTLPTEYYVHVCVPTVHTSLYIAVVVFVVVPLTYHLCSHCCQCCCCLVQEFERLHRNLLTTLGQLQEQHQAVHSKVLCCEVGALVTLGALPPKLNPVIRPLMDCLKTEDDSLLQVTEYWVHTCTYMYMYVHVHVHTCIHVHSIQYTI